jgi:hypothetical protein
MAASLLLAGVLMLVVSLLAFATAMKRYPPRSGVLRDSTAPPIPSLARH